MIDSIKKVFTTLRPIIVTVMLAVIPLSIPYAQIGSRDHQPVIPLTWPDKEKIYEQLFGVDITYPHDIEKLLLATDQEITSEGTYSGISQDGAFTTDALGYTMIDVDSALQKLGPDQQNYVLKHSLTGGLVRGDFMSTLATVTSVLGMAFSQDKNGVREHRLWIVGHVPVPTEVPDSVWEQNFYDSRHGGGGDKQGGKKLFTCPPGYKLKSIQCYNDVVDEYNELLGELYDWAKDEIAAAAQSLEDDLHSIGVSDLTCGMWIGLAMGPYGLISDGLTLLAVIGAIADYNSKVDEIMTDLNESVAALKEAMAAEGIAKCCIKAPPLPGIRPDGSVTLIFKKRGGGNNDGTILRAVLSVMEPGEFDSWTIGLDQGTGDIDDDGIIFSLDDNRLLLVKEHPLGINLDQSITESFSIKSPGPLRIAVSWTDPEAGCCSRLKNDLDAVLKAPDGTYYHGNILAQGRSLPNPTTSDKKNSEEYFAIDHPIPGKWELSIAARGLPHGPQNYVYAITGNIDRENSIDQGKPARDDSQPMISFNSLTARRIDFTVSLTSKSHVKAQLFDLAGRMIETIFDDELACGETVFDHKTDLPNGVYFLQVRVGSISQTGKITIIR